MGLDLHADFRAHEDFAAVHMGIEGNAFLLYFPQDRQGKYLEPAGVGENGTVPSHEFMQAAHAVNQLIAGPDVQMVGIAKLYLAL